MHLRTHSGLAAVMIALAVIGCGSNPNPETAPSYEEANVDRPDLADVLSRHGSALVEIDGVSAVYEGRTDGGEPCIRIGISVPESQLRERLPETLEGWPVVIEEIGEIRPMDDETN